MIKKEAFVKVAEGVREILDYMNKETDLFGIVEHPLSCSIDKVLDAICDDIGDSDGTLFDVIFSGCDEEQLSELYSSEK